MANSGTDDLDFTNYDIDVLYDTVDNSYFRDQDSTLIYEALKERLIQRPFCDYLKRYICRQAELTQNWRDIPLNDYRRIILDAFDENRTPPSFTPTTAKLSALSKNWLTQASVKRNVVFLLGFGLRMSAEDVSDFLIKALHERDINPKNPHEVLCWYCYRNQYGYAKYVQLKTLFDESGAVGVDIEDLCDEGTVGIRNAYASISNETVLMARLLRMKGPNGISKYSYTSHKCFDRLYGQTQEVIAAFFNKDETEKVERSISSYYEAHPMLSESAKRAQANKRLDQRRIYTKNDISAADVEKVLYSAVPADRNGNLKVSISSLSTQFGGKRLSRQRIAGILQSSVEIDRFDLITLNFFLYSQKIEELPDAKSRYLKFVDDTNAILRACSMGELLTSNPYECFLMMCMLSQDPLGTYADVWEMSIEI